MSTASAVLGPDWSTSNSTTFPGRFPLSVERHTMNTVDRLVPGVTTVTLNARYYALHGLAAAEAERRGLGRAAAQVLLRRSEVVLGAVSAHHANADPGAHGGLSRAHGYDLIWPHVRDEGLVDVAALAAPKVYAQPHWGFWAAYRGSEMVLRIVTSGSEIAPGEHLDGRAVRTGLEDVLQLAEEPMLTRADLVDVEHLCLCRSVSSADGQWLAELFAAQGTAPNTRAGTRRQTLRLIARALEYQQVDRVTADLSSFIAYSDALVDGRDGREMTVAAEWRGLVLRNFSVTAWRSLWAWLVGEIDGLTHRSMLAAKFADRLPTGTVGDFRARLPATSAAGRPVPAEPQLGDEAPARYLGVLFLGALRARELSGAELHGFQGHDPEDVYEELAPAWLADRLDEWADRPLRDFACWLTEVLLSRSQRLALRKARLDTKRGVLKVPTRVHLRDDFVFRDSAESGGPASLRCDQLVGILAGVGLFARSGDRWTLGPRGDLIA
ncbi:hypothetical protein [Cryptosporangium japonicum]|uniref:Uncharacterized protein n=1 Tax=Cryptosporangium japonicum TaxID=80872 RepID=A0ABN0V5S9_9ACTN